MLTTTSVAASANQDIDGLLYALKWANPSFSFSFPTSGSTYQPNSDPLGEAHNNFAALNTAQQNEARWVLQQYSSIANVAFTETTETTANHADIRLARTDATSTAWAYLPTSAGSGADVWFSASDSAAFGACICSACFAARAAAGPHDTGPGDAENGDDWLNNSKGYYDDPARGNYAAHTSLHEVGHTLGLVHGHNPFNTFGALPSNHDSLEYSVMTYRSYVGGGTNG